mgnify:CR=1 FL=1
MKIIECEQKSEEWFQARCGIPTASNFSKIITSQGKTSTQREKYMFQLAGEAVIGKSEETYHNAAMIRGIELESEAREYYSFINSVTIDQVGFCLADGYGASPDGFVGQDGVLEIKCPIISTHVGYLLENKLPVEYFQQVHGELLVTGRKWCDFVSYFPGLKPLIIRVERDESFLKKLEIELRVFCKELEDVIAKIK